MANSHRMNPNALLKSMVVVAAYFFVTARFCVAQSTEESSRQLLFRGRPLPMCKSFFIWETGLLGRINSPSGYSFDRSAVTLDMGLMWNRSLTHAIGGLTHLTVADGASRLSALFRYRHWLKGSSSGSGGKPFRVDLDAGLVLVNFNSGKGLNLSSGIGLNLEDLLILTMRFETYRTGAFTYYDNTTYPSTIRTVEGRTSGVFYVGIKGGSYIGATTSVVGGAVLAVFLIAMGNGD